MDSGKNHGKSLQLSRRRSAAIQRTDTRLAKSRRRWQYETNPQFVPS